MLSIETMVNLELLFVLFAALYLNELSGAERMDASMNALAGVFLVFLLFLPLFAVALLLWRGARDELRRGLTSSQHAISPPRASQAKSGTLDTTANPMHSMHAPASAESARPPRAAGAPRAGAGAAGPGRKKKKKSLRTRIHEVYLATEAPTKIATDTEEGGNSNESHT